jgi:hypothetical protein
MIDDAKQKLQVEAAFIDAPRDPDLRALRDYWDSLRRGRIMPSRSDFDPTKVPRLLAHIVLYNVDGPSRYSIRLVGDAVQAFLGKNTTGKPAGTVMNERSAAAMIKILDAIVTERAPKFRTGRTYWFEEKNYRSYEACFLPLSPDATNVNMILAAVKFF